MRKISLFVVLFSFIVVFSIPLSAAGSEAGATPATEGICGGLKANGVTKGLFGLCVAYCEAGANSERVLDNYNRKKNASDPAMPCLAATEPLLACACWNTLTLEDIGVDLAPSSCTLDPTMDYLYYEDGFGGFEFLFATGGVCAYGNTVTNVFAEVQGLSTEQENECRAEILELAAGDFGELGCFTSP